MATFYTTYNQEYAPGVRAAITYEIEQDVAANISIIKILAAAEFRSSGNYYRNGAKVSVAADGKTIESATKAIGIGSYAGYGLDFKFTPDSITIKHNDDGTKTGLTITATFDIQGTKNTGSVVIDLPPIPRGNKYSIDKTMLTPNTAATLTATKINEAYTSTIEWTNGVMSGQIAGKSAATQWELNYSTLSAGIPAGLTRVASIICTTYNGDTAVMVTILQIAINTGSIVLSLYDNGNGKRGATFNKRAEGPGFFMPMQNNVAIIESNHSYTLNSSKTYGTVKWEVTPPEGYKIIGIVGSTTGNVVTAIAGCWGIQMDNGNYEVSIRYVLNYSTQSGTQTASVKLLAIYTG